MRVGIVGLGDIAEKAWLPVLLAQDGVEPVLVTRDERRLAGLQARHRVREGHRSVDLALDRMGLAALAAVPVRLLSAGQAKRAALARVALSGAPLWLLDEPFNALDAEGVQRLDATMRRHLDEGGAILLASHSAPAGHWPRRELGA